jgi:hypothetical protein
MKEFILKIIEVIVTALNEFFEALSYDDKKAYKKQYPPAASGNQAAPAVAPSTQAKNPPVNQPLPVTVPPEPPEYKRNLSVLTFQERKLLSAIRKAVKDEYIILMKIRMGDFIYIANQPKDGTFYPNQVMYKHADFLLCGKLRIEPLLVIELDDSSHNSVQRMESDKVKNETCDAVGLPYLRIKLQKWYDADMLKMQIKEKILEEAPLFASEPGQ